MPTAFVDKDLEHFDLSYAAEPFFEAELLIFGESRPFMDDNPLWDRRTRLKEKLANRR